MHVDRAGCRSRRRRAATPGPGPRGRAAGRARRSTPASARPARRAPRAMIVGRAHDRAARAARCARRCSPSSAAGRSSTSTSAMPGTLRSTYSPGGQQRGGQQLEHRVLGPADARRCPRAGRWRRTRMRRHRAQYGPAAAVATVVVVHPAGGARRRPRRPATTPSCASGPTATARFVADDGPVPRLRAHGRRDRDDGDVEERTDFRLGGRRSGALFVLPGYRHAHAGGRPASAPWWAPPERARPRGPPTCSACCARSSLVGGYLGTLITQTATFAADEFGVEHDRAVGRAGRRPGSASLHRHRARRRWPTAAAGAAWSPSPPAPGASLAATGALAPNLVGARRPARRVARGFAAALAAAHRHRVGRGDAGRQPGLRATAC